MIDVLGRIVGFRRGESAEHVRHVNQLTAQLLDRLTEVSSGGDWPRDVQFTPDGRFLVCCNERSNRLACSGVRMMRLLTRAFCTPGRTVAKSMMNSEVECDMIARFE